MSAETPVQAVSAATPADDHLIELWLHERSRHTQRAYRADVGRFRAWAGKPLRAVTLTDLQAFAKILEGGDASRYRSLSAVKSLLAFGHRLGYLPFDVGRALRLPSVRNRLNERILSEADLHRILSLEPNPPEPCDADAAVRLRHPGERTMQTRLARSAAEWRGRSDHRLRERERDAVSSVAALRVAASSHPAAE